MDQKGSEIVRSVLRCYMVAIIITIILFLLCSVLLWLTSLPERYLGLYAMICCGIGAGICGFSAGGCMKQKGMIWGTLFGFGYVVLLILCLILVTDGSVFPSISNPKWLLCIGISALSGTLSVNLRKE